VKNVPDGEINECSFSILHRWPSPIAPARGRDANFFTLSAASSFSIPNIFVAQAVQRSRPDTPYIAVVPKLPPFWHPPEKLWHRKSPAATSWMLSLSGVDRAKGFGLA